MICTALQFQPSWSPPACKTRNDSSLKVRIKFFVARRQTPWVWHTVGQYAAMNIDQAGWTLKNWGPKARIGRWSRLSATPPWSPALLFETALPMTEAYNLPAFHTTNWVTITREGSRKETVKTRSTSTSEQNSMTRQTTKRQTSKTMPRRFSVCARTALPALIWKSPNSYWNPCASTNLTGLSFSESEGTLNKKLYTGLSVALRTDSKGKNDRRIILTSKRIVSLLR